MKMLVAVFAGIAFALPLLANSQEPPQLPSPPPLPPPPGFQNGPAFPDLFRPVAQQFKDLIPSLIEALKDADPEVRQHSALALANLGRDAVKPLTEALADANKERRAAAAYALGQLGQQGREAIPALLKLLKDEDTAVRRATSMALNRLTSQENNSFGFPVGRPGGIGMPGWSNGPAVAPLPLPAIDPPTRPAPPPLEKKESK